MLVCWRRTSNFTDRHPLRSFPSDAGRPGRESMAADSDNGSTGVLEPPNLTAHVGNHTYGHVTEVVGPHLFSLRFPVAYLVQRTVRFDESSL